MRTGIRSLRSGGTAVVVGLGAEEMALPIQYIGTNEITLTGTFRYANTWPTAIELATTHRVELDPMVTGRFPLEQAQAAMDGDEDPLTMKSVIAVNE